MNQSIARGRVIRRGEPGFDAAVLSTSFSARDPGVRPDVLVQANDAAEVVDAIGMANLEGLRVSVRSGGHSWNQNHLREGGMLIDLSRLNAIDVRPAEMVAVVGPAAHGGDLDAALAPLKLFFPVAHAYTVGLGGFLLTGGFGWGCRTYGMACESVVGIDVALADGRVVHASETENPDLLWAARGSGPGFFGVIVAFHLRLHRRPRFTGVKVQVFRIEHLEDVYRWATSVGPQVSHKVEFQMVMNRKAAIIGKHGIEVVSPVLADSYREARNLVSFISKSPIRSKASLTLPLIPVSLGTIMRGAEKVVFPPGARWAVDNMWIDGPIEPLLPHLRRAAETQPAPPAHSLWMNWNPRTRERPDMAFSLEGRSYLALYGAIKGDTIRPADETWAEDNIRAMEPYSAGIQLGDENLARRSATFTTPANAARMAALRSLFDPDRRFRSYAHDVATPTGVRVSA